MEEIKVFQPTEGNKFYQCTVKINGENPDNGKPKVYKEIHLVESPSTAGIDKKIASQMEGTMYSWEITNISESKIQFVY